MNNPLLAIHALGAQVRLSPGQGLIVAGLDRLPRERAEAVLSLARQHKAALLAALRPQATAPADASVCSLTRGVVTLEVDHGPACRFCAGLRRGPEWCDWPGCPLHQHARGRETVCHGAPSA